VCFPIYHKFFPREGPPVSLKIVLVEEDLGKMFTRGRLCLECFFFSPNFRMSFLFSRTGRVFFCELGSPPSFYYHLSQGNLFFSKSLRTLLTGRGGKDPLEKRSREELSC